MWVVLFTLIYVLLSMASGLAFYASTKHQTFAPWLHRRYAKHCLSVSLLCLVASVVCAIQALGKWPGIYAALTSFMLVCVALPYIAAWSGDAQKSGSQKIKPTQRKNKHVG